MVFAQMGLWGRVPSRVAGIRGALLGMHAAIFTNSAQMCLMLLGMSAGGAFGHEGWQGRGGWGRLTEHFW